MFPIFQRYNFESNSQQYGLDTYNTPGCFRYFKDTILKAIHNVRPACAPTPADVSDISKIQFENDSKL